MNLSVGNSVVVNPGVIDPDFDFEIGEWQGRIEEIDGEGLVLIRWDSVTLAQMPLDLVIQCENENFDWEIMMLDAADIQMTKERDSAADTHNAAMRIKLRIMDEPRLDDDYGVHMEKDDPSIKPVQVECYSGYKANERPVAFIFQGDRWEVSEILDRWYEGGIEPDRPIVYYFKVKAEGDVFILRYELETDEWSVMFSGLK